jgi:hypothetical protein
MNEQTKLELLKMAVELTRIAAENVNHEKRELTAIGIAQLFESYTFEVVSKYERYIPVILQGDSE